MKDIKINYEARRGCGFRKPGLYLMSDQPLAPCGRLPIELGACPVCGEGIKPSRGWTWIGAELIKSKAANLCMESAERFCASCPLHDLNKLPFERAGLLWIGERFYRQPPNFMAEAKAMGISRRINFLPRGFKLGETWVFLAHRFALEAAEKGKQAAIFTLFRPERIEQVVKGTETPEQIKAIERRGFVPVIVRKKEENSVEEEGL